MESSDLPIINMLIEDSRETIKSIEEVIKAGGDEIGSIPGLEDIGLDEVFLSEGNNPEDVLSLIRLSLVRKKDALEARDKDIRTARGLEKKLPVLAEAKDILIWIQCVTENLKLYIGAKTPDSRWTTWIRDSLKCPEDANFAKQTTNPHAIIRFIARKYMSTENVHNIFLKALSSGGAPKNWKESKNNIELFLAKWDIISSMNMEKILTSNHLDLIEISCLMPSTRRDYCEKIANLTDEDNWENKEEVTAEALNTMLKKLADPGQLEKRVDFMIKFLKQERKTLNILERKSLSQSMISTK